MEKLLKLLGEKENGLFFCLVRVALSFLLVGLVMSRAFANFSKFSFLFCSNNGAKANLPFSLPVLITFGRRGLMLIISDD